MTIEERLERIEKKLDLLLRGKVEETAAVLDVRYLATLPIEEAKRIQRERMREQKRGSHR